MFNTGPISGDSGLDPLILLLFALVVEACIGDPTRFFKIVPHPVVVVGRAVDWAEPRLNRDKRSTMNRAVRGALLVLALILSAFATGLAIGRLTLDLPFGWIVEFLLLITMLAQRSLFIHVRNVAKALDAGGLDDAKREVAKIVGRDPDQLDEHGVCRAAIESLAENFSDGIVAPVFWYVLFGMPGLLVYKTVNTLDSMIGHRSERFHAFGMTAARLDDILNLFPARISGLFIVMAATVAPTANPWRAFKIMTRDARKHRSPNAGWPEGAMAGALGLALAGPRRYRNQATRDPWLGDGPARAASRDIDRALYVYVAACLINAIWVGALSLIRPIP